MCIACKRSSGTGKIKASSFLLHALSEVERVKTYPIYVAVIDLNSIVDKQKQTELVGMDGRMFSQTPSPVILTFLQTFN